VGWVWWDDGYVGWVCGVGCRDVVHGMDMWVGYMGWDVDWVCGLGCGLGMWVGMWIGYVGWDVDWVHGLGMWIGYVDWDVVWVFLASLLCNASTFQTATYYNCNPRS
jgi:hypothetical protein